MKTINWNQMSELGLIERINKEMLHPLGLALSRTVETGSSDTILISDDGGWEYDPKMELKPILNKEEIQEKLSKMISST